MARNLIVINVDFKETRVALIEEGVIAELQIERAAHRSTVGNVVLGRVTRVLPGMQAAFIDVGQERAAFLHVEDLIRPDDFDAYLASDAREKVKLKSAEDSGDAEHSDSEAGAVAVAGALPAEAVEAGGRTAARRGRRRRGRRGRGRERLPGTTSTPLDDSAGEDLAAEAEELDAGPESGTANTLPATEAEEFDDRDEGSEDVDYHEGRSGLFDDIEFGEARDEAEFRSRPTADDDGDEIEFDTEEADADDDEAIFRADVDADDVDDVEDADDSDVEDADDSDVEYDADADDEDDVDEFDADDGDEGIEDEADEEGVEDDASDDEADEEGIEDDEEPPSERGVAEPSARASAPDSETSGVLIASSLGIEAATAEVVAVEGERAPDRPSHVQLVPPSADESDEEPPSSGERQTNEERTAFDEDEADTDESESSEDEAEDESADGAGDTEAVLPDPAGAEGTSEGRRGRGRRRRRRRGGNKEAAPAAVADAVAPAREVEQAASAVTAADADAGRRGGRRRRGRRRGGNGNGARPEAKVATETATPAVASDTARRMPLRVSRSVPITEVVKEGDQVVVQISKEPIGTKGARVTSHVSLPGRYVVYLPTVDHVGISKRIGNARERARLRKSIEAIKPANGGLIVRTVAEGLTKKQLKADIGYLIKVWADVAKRRETAKSAEILYEELDLVLKAARDLFTDEVQQIVIDDREQHGRLCRFVEMFMAGRVKDIKLYSGDEPIFDAYGIEDEIKRALSRKVPLPSGGSLIMDQAEALTAIDVNTGRYVGKGSKDLEETALKTNLEAVDEIAYQLRFRNIGGLVILDLIDMEKADNRDKVWRALEQKLAKDKAKTTINRISELGLIEMTRKRTRESLGRIMHEPCFYCDGTGNIQSRETIAYEILRQIRRDRNLLTGYSVRVLAHPAVVDFLKHEARDALQDAERRYMRRIELVPRQEYHIEQYDLQGR